MAASGAGDIITGDIVGWTVIFYGRPQGWERLVMRDGFRHVSAFGWIGGQRWLEIDPGVKRIACQLFDDEGFLRRRVELFQLGSTEIRLEAQLGTRSVFWPMTCTQVVAGVLGVRTGALRPQALYRVLTARSRIRDATREAAQGHQQHDHAAG